MSMRLSPCMLFLHCFLSHSMLLYRPYSICLAGLLSALFPPPFNTQISVIPSKLLSWDILHAHIETSCLFQKIMSCSNQSIGGGVASDFLGFLERGVLRSWTEIFPVNGHMCTTDLLLLPQTHLANTEMLKVAVNICRGQYDSNKRTETNIFVCTEQYEFPLQLPEPLKTIKLLPLWIVFASVYF